MSIAPDAAFSMGDLAVFDDAHLRLLITSVPGALSPTLVGHAFASVGNRCPAPLARLAERIERALAPDNRDAFARARRRLTTRSLRCCARRTVLDHLFWELTYWKTPDTYERLTAGEQVHLGALDFARPDSRIVLDAGAGTGRITLPLARRARKVFAMDPAPPLLDLLARKLASADLRGVEPLRGAFQHVPLPDDSVDAVVSCSAFGAQDAQGGVRGLDEFFRVTRPGGRIVMMWPQDAAWFARQGFHHTHLPGHLGTTFPTLEEALALARRFYGPNVVRYLQTTHRPRLPFWVRGIKAPRDLCWLTVRK